jgi:hypothetical protein
VPLALGPFGFVSGYIYDALDRVELDCERVTRMI